MTRNEAINYIKENAKLYLLEDKSGKGYVCPICGSGNGPNGTGITTTDNIHYTCWAGCYTNSDIIDIIGLMNNCDDFLGKLKLACEKFGINYDALESDREPAYKNDKNEQYKPTKQDTEQTDYMTFFKECAEKLHETDYLTKRGISEETQQLFLIGYCPKWQSPTALRKGSNPPATPRIIIPTSKNSYIARDTRSEINEREKAFTKMKEGRVNIFNQKGLYKNQEPIFIVEGEIDALSVIDVGYNCIALGSVNNCNKLKRLCEERKPTGALLIALDNDKEQEMQGKRNVGKETAEKLLKDLKGINVECYIVDINGGYKDANEALMANRDLFKQNIERVVNDITSLEDAETQEYLATSTLNYMKAFKESILESAKTSYIPTGFSKLDEVLDGGLYEGFYCIGAISSLGKTTFVLQMADQIAKAGTDVLIFSLEMARNELIAKSVSRITSELVESRKLPQRYKKTTRGIMVHKFYEDYSREEKELINEAIEEYTKYSHRIYIKEGVGNIGALQIREDVKKHISITGNTPVVIIDYLQILAPYDDRKNTDKQNIDLNVTELKRISRDYKLPLIGISSFNRTNYSNKVSMEAFKESGNIEYSTDVLIGLQLYGVGRSDFDVDEAKSKEPRAIEARILKNRNGQTGVTVDFDYFPKENYYTEEIDLRNNSQK